MSAFPGGSILAGAFGTRRAGRSASAASLETPVLEKRPPDTQVLEKQSPDKPKIDNRAKQPPTRRPRRPFSNAVLHAPQVLRALVRADEVWLVALAAFVGGVAGVAVWMMTEATQLTNSCLASARPSA